MSKELVLLPPEAPPGSLTYGAPVVGEEPDDKPHFFDDQLFMLCRADDYYGLYKELVRRVGAYQRRQAKQRKVK